MEAEHVVTLTGNRRQIGLGLTGTGILKGFDFAGKELWARDIQKEYGTFD